MSLYQLRGVPDSTLNYPDSGCRELDGGRTVEGMNQQPVTANRLPAGQLRISDADRSMVSDVLTTAYADGRITRDELDERTTQVLAAKVFDDLSPITADLMPKQVAAVYSTPTPARTSHHSVQISPAALHQEPSRISAILSSQKRPQYRLHTQAQVSAIMGEVKLDLTEGAMESEHCTINLQLVMGELTLHVPEGIRIINRLNPIMGEVNLKGIPASNVDDPSITLVGSLVMSEVNVIGPEHKSWTKRLGLTS